MGIGEGEERDGARREEALIGYTVVWLLGELEGGDDAVSVIVPSV